MTINLYLDAPADTVVYILSNELRPDDATLDTWNMTSFYVTFFANLRGVGWSELGVFAGPRHEGERDALLASLAVLELAPARCKLKIHISPDTTVDAARLWLTWLLEELAQHWPEAKTQLETMAPAQEAEGEAAEAPAPAQRPKRPRRPRKDLPERRVRIYSLYYEKAMTLEEIAEAEDLSTKTVQRDLDKEAERLAENVL